MNQVLDYRKYMVAGHLVSKITAVAGILISIAVASATTGLLTARALGGDATLLKPLAWLVLLCYLSSVPFVIRRRVATSCVLPPALCVTVTAAIIFFLAGFLAS